MSDLFSIYDSVCFAASVRYRDPNSARMLHFGNVVRVVIASISDRTKVFCTENPPYMDEIAEALQPSAGIPNGDDYWFETAQIKQLRELLNKKENGIELTNSRLKAVAVQDKNDFVFLTKVCNVRTLMIDEHIFTEEDECPSNTEDERKLEETDSIPN